MNEETTPVSKSKTKSGKLLNLSDLSKLTGFERRKISDILSEANLEYTLGKQNAKHYNPVLALPLLYQNGALPKAANPESSELKNEKLLLAVAKRKNEELNLAERLREVVQTSEVTAIVEQEYNIIRAQFRALPSKLAKHLAVLSNPQQVFELLAASIDEALAELQTDSQLSLEKSNIPEMAETAEDTNDAT